MKPVDPIDQRILAEMRANARISHAHLGEIVRLSRNAVRQRIERLERDGHILGYTIVEKAPAAHARVTATMLVSRRDRMRGADVITSLQTIPEIVECDVVAGELDLIVRVEVEDPQRIREIWQQVADLSGVTDIRTAMSLSRVIDRRN